MQIRRKGSLGIFSLAMITAGSVDSIRNLPATALFGATIFFFFFLATVFFLLPTALVSAELSSTSPEDGGIYVWVKQAFGEVAGFFAVWFQWVENLFYYPAILSFIAATIGYLIAPSLASNKFFLVSMILAIFWATTLINLFGIKISARIANFSTIFGLILPMTIIIFLGALWLIGHHPTQIHFNRTALLPSFHHAGLWTALTGIILSFCGMEIATVYGNDAKNPQKDYPRALMIAVGIIVLTLICGSLAIAVVIPEGQISLVSGIMQAFDVFFSSAHLHFILPLMALMLVIGGVGTVNNWIIAPVRGLQIAAEDGNLPKHMRLENRFGAPVVLLLYQAVIVTGISFAFLWMPSVNGSYWLLTVLAAHLYMVMYIMMFVSAIRLRYVDLPRKSGFMLPGSHWGMWVVAGAGIIGALVTIVVGFMPPTDMNVGGTWHFESLLVVGLLVMSVPPFFLHRLSSK